MGIFDCFVRRKGGQIKISTTPIHEDVKEIKVAEDMHTDEDVCKFFIDKLTPQKEIEKFKIDRRSDAYLTLWYGNNDFLRVKYSSNVKWLSISISIEDRKIYSESSLFEKQVNKNQRHWKAYISSFNDLYKFLEIANNACFELANEFVLSEEEQAYVDAFRNELIKLGADKNSITQDKTSEYLTIYYRNRRFARFRLYKRKKNKFFVENTGVGEKLAITAGLDIGKDYYIEFDSLENLIDSENIKKYIHLFYNDVTKAL